MKLVKYNKDIQNKICIDIINYKIFSGRYIIYEPKRKENEHNSYNDTLIFKEEIKGKEYHILNNALIYEGEYLNGERNGKGKEYGLLGNLIFEGEYLNGKRNGKGKQYDFNGTIKFEGEYLKGKMWNIKRYDIKGNIIYELKNGKGYVKEYDMYNNKLIYEGNF